MARYVQTLLAGVMTINPDICCVITHTMLAIDLWGPAAER